MSIYLLTSAAATVVCQVQMPLFQDVLLFLKHYTKQVFISHLFMNNSFHPASS
jgi:hypothetical protein